jgi:hypothetical protein
MQIAAPSFWPDALPAVTVASGSSGNRTGRSRANVSTSASGRTCPSRANPIALHAIPASHHG